MCGGAAADVAGPSLTEIVGRETHPAGPTPPYDRGRRGAGATCDTASIFAVLAADARASKPLPRRQVFDPQDENESHVQEEDFSGTAGLGRGPSLAASAALRRELGSPPLDLRSQPELYAPVAELVHRARHVLISVLVDADRVAVSESQDLRNPIRVKEIVDVDLTAHGPRLLQYSDPSEPSDRLQ